MWSSRLLTDKDEILGFLRGDEVYAAYAIGDLEPEMFAQSLFAGAEVDGRLRALVLHFRGLEMPALLLMGEADGISAILANELCPEQVYLTFRDKHRAVARQFYYWEHAVPMWRMALEPGQFRPATGDCVRLRSDHVRQLKELYGRGGADAFSPAQVEWGVFYGIWHQDEIVAAAGTHLVSPTYGVAAVGNVFVHPDHRRQGHGIAATSAVIEQLLRLGTRTVILNVAQNNEGAIRMYERLGFERYCPFFECPVATAIR